MFEDLLFMAWMVILVPAKEPEKIPQFFPFGGGQRADYITNAPAYQPFYALSKQFQTILLASEFIHEKDRSSWFVKEHETYQDIVLTQQLMRNLSNTPSLYWRFLLPHKKVAEAFINLNSKHLEYLSDVYSLYRYKSTKQAMEVTEELGKMWSLIKYIQDDDSSVAFRRMSFKQLVEMVGEDAIIKGKIPPPLPIYK